KEINFIAERTLSGDSKPKYIIYHDGDLFATFIMNGIMSTLRPNENFVQGQDRIISFHLRSNSNEADSKIAALGIGESKKILNYQTNGGNNTQIYLRMNSVYPLKKAIKKGEFYQNNILKDVQIKHYTSVEMLKYLFTKEQKGNTRKERIVNYSNWFWDNIEDYFMRIIPNEVKDSLDKTRK